MGNQVLSIRDEISERWHSQGIYYGSDSNFGFSTRDRYIAFCVAKDWLQDTGEALMTHRRRGFCDDPHLAYLEFWGVLQAVAVQQDAIGELHYAVTGDKLPGSVIRQPAWGKVRNLRHLAVGHPTRRGRGCDGRLRSVSGRQPKSYDLVELSVYGNADSKIDRIALGQMIDAYDSEAAEIMVELRDDFYRLFPE